MIKPTFHIDFRKETRAYEHPQPAVQQKDEAPVSRLC